MKRDIWLWQLWGFAVTSLGGTVLHFLYDWTGQSLLAAPFSGVNESTWEHMKLLFWPMFIFTLIGWRAGRPGRDYFCVKLIGTTAGLLLIPALFYTANGAFGPTPDWLNIAIFFVAAGLAYLLEGWLFTRELVACRRPWAAVLAFCLLALAFVVFTFIPPQLPLFADPLDGSFGIGIR